MIIGTRMLVLALLVASAAGTACTLADPYSRTGYTTKKSGSDKGEDDTAGDDDDSTPPVTTKSARTAPAPSDAGTKAPAETSDAGAAAPPAPIDPFAGAPPYAPITLATDTSQHHLGDSNAGRDCLQCHDGKSTAPGFAVGGTVRQTATSTQGATGVQVRIIDPSGVELALMGTDSEGNFWLKGADKKIPPGSHVAIRNGSTEKKMSGSISAGSCNTAGCHDPNRPIWLNAAN